MAIGIHIVRIGFLAIDRTTGLPVNKSSATTTINQTLNTQHNHVVLPSESVPNSASYPTVDTYLTLEAAAGYVLSHMDQNMIVTYDQAQINNA